jgi:hypothetical protein
LPPRANADRLAAELTGLDTGAKRAYAYDIYESGRIGDRIPRPSRGRHSSWLFVDVQITR